MSWYSKIYIYVREYRAQHPISGLILHLLLYTMLVVQFCGIGYAYSTYIILTCGVWLTSHVQITIYLIIYNSLLILMLWSLLMTICTSVSRVPKEYHVGPEIDQKLKEITPKAGERYTPDSSTPEQVQQQSQILQDFASDRGLTFVELDTHGRLRYCYQCSLIKPDRSHHCSSCGFCVVKFDHHCPWINKCVSYRNYKYFLLYLFYGTSFLVFELLTSLEVIVRYATSDDPAEKWPKFLPVALSILIHIAFSYYPLGELLIYHAKLVWDNETTCEQAKIPIIRGDQFASYNITPYLNYRSVFGWGLWAFPVPTFVSDGCHFNIRYSENYAGERYEVVLKDPSQFSSRSRTLSPPNNNNNVNNQIPTSISTTAPRTAPDVVAVAPLALQNGGNNNGSNRAAPVASSAAAAPTPPAGGSGKSNQHAAAPVASAPTAAGGSKKSNLQSLRSTK